MSFGAGNAAAIASSILSISRRRNGTTVDAYEAGLWLESECIVREQVETIWNIGIVGADLVSTPASEQSALAKLLANWRALVAASALPLYEQGGL